MREHLTLKDLGDALRIGPTHAGLSFDSALFKVLIVARRFPTQAAHIAADRWRKHIEFERRFGRPPGQDDMHMVL